MHTSRLFEIIYLLLNKKTTTAKKLAEHFGVSRRTIYRDIDTLSLSGIPVYTEKGKGGGISLLPGFVLDKSILSETEQDEILSALQGLSSIQTTGTDSVLSKLSTVFNKSTVKWLEVDFTGWDYQNNEMFHSFKTAILERRIAEFDYYSTFGEKTHRRIEPVQLWFKSKAWYLKGFCLMRQDMRLFKLTRIRDLSVTDEFFTEREFLTLPDESGPEEHRINNIELVLRIAPEMAYRVLDEFSDAVKHQDGSFTVNVIWSENEWLYGYILSFGEYMEVIEPEHIRTAVKNKLLKSAEKYL